MFAVLNFKNDNEMGVVNYDLFNGTGDLLRPWTITTGASFKYKESMFVTEPFTNQNICELRKLGVEETKANALLIRSAPDLLKLLIDIYSGDNNISEDLKDRILQTIINSTAIL
jgi:hypothetical protein